MLRHVGKENPLSNNLNFTKADLEAFGRTDTPTILNALERLMPERRHIGYTVERCISVHPDLPTRVGLARTALLRTQEAPRGSNPTLHDFGDYIAEADLPTVVLVQDVDERPGYGAFVGEVAANIYRGLGAVAYVTNGAARDTKAIPSDFQVVASHIVPSHTHFHIFGIGSEVKVLGMQAIHDDVIAVDYHGACVIPHDAVKKLPPIIDTIMENEKKVLEFIHSPGFNSKSMREFENAMRRGG